MESKDYESKSVISVVSDFQKREETKNVNSEHEEEISLTQPQVG